MKRAPAGEDIGRVDRIVTRVALALAVLLFVPGLLDPFHVPKAEALRGLGLGLLAAAAVRFAAARSNGAARDTSSGGATGRGLDVAVAVWAGVGVLSAIAANSPRLAISGEIGQREGVLTTLALAGLYIAARRGHRDSRHAATTLAVLAGAAGIAALYALFQRAGIDPVEWANPALYPQGGGRVLRPFATLGNPILLGAVLAPALAIQAAALATERGGAWWRAPLAALLGAALVATLSRGAWLAASFGVLVAVAPGLWSRTTRARSLVALAAATLPAAAWGLLAARESVSARLAEGLSPSVLSGPVRREIARGALELWRAHPWLGLGPDGFGLAFPAVQRPDMWRLEWVGTPLHAHSAVLQVAATLGLAGVGAGALWLLAVGLGLRARLGAADPQALALAAALVALAVGGAFNAVGLAGATLFVLLSALAAGGTEPARAPRAARWAALAGVAVTAGFAAVAGREFPAYRAAGEARAALEASLARTGGERAGLSNFASERSRAALERVRGEDQLWRIACDAALARVRDRQASGDTAGNGAWREFAEGAARAALRLEPERASHWQRLGDALAARAEHERANGSAARAEPAMAQAEAAFLEAERRAPSDALLLGDHAAAELRLGRGARALVPARRMVALYPEAAAGHVLEAAAWLALGREGETVAALRRAAASRWEAEEEARRRRVHEMLADSVRVVAPAALFPVAPDER